MSEEANKPNFQFDHKKYESKKISLNMLDKQMDFITESGGGKLGAIIAGAKIVIFFAYLWARKKLIDEQMMIDQQEYEQGIVNQNRDDVNTDTLD